MIYAFDDNSDLQCFCFQKRINPNRRVQKHKDCKYKKQTVQHKLYSFKAHFLLKSLNNTGI